MRRVASNALVSKNLRRKGNLTLIKPSGRPKYSAPIRTLANMPDMNTANSGYHEVAEKMPEATKRIAITGYSKSFIPNRATA